MKFLKYKWNLSYYIYLFVFNRGSLSSHDKAPAAQIARIIVSYIICELLVMFIECIMYDANYLILKIMIREAVVREVFLTVC